MKVVSVDAPLVVGGVFSSMLPLDALWSMVGGAAIFVGRVDSSEKMLSRDGGGALLWERCRLDHVTVSEAFSRNESGKWMRKTGVYGSSSALLGARVHFALTITGGKLRCRSSASSSAGSENGGM